MNTILSFVAIGFSVLVVSSSNTIYSLIYLIGLFLTVASILIVQGITYIGILYIVVYVGAIAILFLFVVIMINVRDVELNTTGSNFTKNLPLTLILGTLFYNLISEFAGSLSISPTSLYSTIAGSKTNINGLTDLGTISDSTITSFTIVEALGQTLYTWGGLWLLIAAIILLLCIVGPIVLTLVNTDPKG